MECRNMLYNLTISPSRSKSIGNKDRCSCGDSNAVGLRNRRLPVRVGRGVVYRSCVGGNIVIDRRSGLNLCRLARGILIPYPLAFSFPGKGGAL